MADKKSKVEERAYYKYLERGAQDGHDMDDWLDAEKEMSTKKPAAKKPVAKKITVKKPAAKKPATKKTAGKTK